MAVEVTLLTGRYVATAHHDRDEHEWPPHPARLFSALVAAWADADRPDPLERDALEWLETLPAPAISASLPDDVAVRRTVSHFVPVNDAAVSKGSATAAEVLPEGVLAPSSFAWRSKSTGRYRRSDGRGDWVTGRKRQERQFPSVAPPCPCVTFVWDRSADAPITEALDGLLSRVTRLGHSSSLVSCRLSDEIPAPTMRPGSGSLVLRCPQRGQLAALEQAHRAHRGMRPRSLPFAGTRYSSAAADEAGDASAAVRPDIAGELIVFEVPIDKRRFPATRTVELTEALRGAVLHHADDPLPEGLSGHRPAGGPTPQPHIAFLALPSAGHGRADGRIMGLAVMLPAAMSDDAARAAYRAIGNWEQAGPHRRCRLMLRGGEAVDLRRRQPPFELSSLRERTWSRQASSWVSVTPIALPKNPGRLSSGSPAARSKAWLAAEEQVRQSCIHVGLPRPEAVAVSLDPLIAGACGASQFPALVQGSRRGDGVRRRLVHAEVRFDAPIGGPVVLGSGRFFGLGLMQPQSHSNAIVGDGRSPDLDGR